MDGRVEDLESRLSLSSNMTIANSYGPVSASLEVSNCRPVLRGKPWWIDQLNDREYGRRRADVPLLEGLNREQGSRVRRRVRCSRQ